MPSILFKFFDFSTILSLNIIFKKISKIQNSNNIAWADLDLIVTAQNPKTLKIQIAIESEPLIQIPWHFVFVQRLSFRWRIRLVLGLNFPGWAKWQFPVNSHHTWPSFTKYTYIQWLIFLLILILNHICQLYTKFQFDSIIFQRVWTFFQNTAKKKYVWPVLPLLMEFWISGKYFFLKMNISLIVSNYRKRKSKSFF